MMKVARYIACFLMAVLVPAAAGAQLVQKVVSIENEVLSAYLDDSDYDPSDYSYTKMTEYVPPVYGRYDKPAPVVFSWDASFFWKEVQLEIFSSESEDIPIIRLITPTKNLSCNVYNLIPDRFYHYTFKARSGDILFPLEEGTFYVEGRRRMIRADFMTNIRDFGGMETEDGRMLCFGKLYRGAAMDHVRGGARDTLVTPDGISVLRNLLNIGADIDLRGARELLLNDDDPSNDMVSSPLGKDVEYYNFPITDFGGITSNRQYGAVIAQVVDCLERGKNVYIHCAAGADRTGVLSFLLGAMAGVSENELARDYELTCLAHGKSASHSRNSTGAYNYAPSIEYIKSNFRGKTLAEKVQHYLIAKHGVTRKQINTFRRIMVDE